MKINRVSGVQVEGVLTIIHRHDLFYTVTALRKNFEAFAILIGFENFETFDWFELGSSHVPTCQFVSRTYVTSIHDGL